jgi:anti-sigma B factor antagonist
MEIAITPLDSGVRLARLIGRLDAKGSAEIEQVVTIQWVASGVSTILDLSDVSFLASIGMRLLISAARGLSGKDARLVLLSPQPLVREALETAGFDTLIPILDDLEAAEAAVLGA